MSAPTVSEILALEELIRGAGQEILRIRESGSEVGIDTQTKADGSLVTLADSKSDEILVDGLQTLFPEALVLSEERPRDETACDVDQWIWLIDPLDGTGRFVGGHDDFGILVAGIHQAVVQIGIMFFPALDRFIIGNRVDTGGTTLCNGEPLRVSTAPELRDKRVYYRGPASPDHPSICLDFLDSGVALYQVASGELDGAVLSFEKLGDWDIAAPACVIELAGGRVTDEKGRDLCFGTEPLAASYIVASHGQRHDELLGILDVSTE